MMERSSRYGPPLPRRPDGSLYEMSEAQRRQAAKLIARECSNYDRGNCFLLDDGEECVCPQVISYTVLCRWFRNAVLPRLPELEAEIFKNRERKRCEQCGAFFVPKSNRGKYCPACALRIRRKQKAECERRRRLAAIRGNNEEAN